MKMMSRLPIAVAALLIPGLLAQSVAVSYDYFVLALSWAPNFCAGPGEAARNPAECAPGKNVGFVVHGLWPERISGQSPESCGKSTEVKKVVVNSILPYMPSRALVQHEWATHGTCSGLSQTAYFSGVLTARSSVQIPVQFTSLDSPVQEGREQIEAQFAQANPTFPATAFRTSCQAGQLAEVRVCFDRNFKPRECTESVADCSSRTMQIRPPS
jgi:ribonuclease T2